MKKWLTKLFNEKVLIPIIDKLQSALGRFRAKLNEFPEPVEVRRAEEVTRNVARHTKSGGPHRG